MQTKRIVLAIFLAVAVGLVLSAPQALRFARSETEPAISAQAPTAPVRPVPPTRPGGGSKSDPTVPRPPSHPVKPPQFTQEAFYDHVLAQIDVGDGSPDLSRLARRGRYQISSWANDVWAGYFVLDSNTGQVVRARRWLIDLIPEEEYETSCEADFFRDSEE